MKKGLTKEENQLVDKIFEEGTSIIDGNNRDTLFSALVNCSTNIFNKLYPIISEDKN